jgi:hypothetical protein
MLLLNLALLLYVEMASSGMLLFAVTNVGIPLELNESERDLKTGLKGERFVRKRF